MFRQPEGLPGDRCFDELRERRQKEKEASNQINITEEQGKGILDPESNQSQGNSSVNKKPGDNSFLRIRNLKKQENAENSGSQKLG